MKIGSKFMLLSGTVITLFNSSVFAEPSNNFKVFLCFGQSNIAGGLGVTPQGDVTQTKPRVMALAFNSCSNPEWQKDKWVLAKEPLHCGDGGAGDNTMGPVVVFGKAMADSLPNDTIGLIPCGQSGVNIEHFMRGGKCTAGYCVKYPGSDAYNWMVKKCKLAMERGVLAGIMLHQGEANRGDTAWLGKVKTIYEDLKKDLGITKDIPLVAGELLYAGENGSSKHNPIIAKIPQTLPLGYVASAQGLSGGGTYADLHFNQDGYRKMGQRMAAEMMKGLYASGILTDVAPRPSPKRVQTISNLQETSTTALYTINGKKLPSSVIQNIASGKKHCIYVMQKPGTQASLVVSPR
ncbi:MAG: hypothetical protein JW915_14455 [Chitinispirillaceae bacterium]|nr:hypothetical protein [Chitinispirillaceae bacterium]